MSTMRAVLIKDGKGPIENLYIGEAPKPALAAGQVMVKVSIQLLSSIVRVPTDVFS